MNKRLVPFFSYLVLLFLTEEWPGFDPGLNRIIRTIELSSMQEIF